MICKANSALLQQYTGELMELLRMALTPSPGESSEGGLAAHFEGSLLYTGHLIVTISSQDPLALIPMTVPLLSLSAYRALKSEMPTCVRSFILPIAYALKMQTQADPQLALLTLL